MCFTDDFTVLEIAPVSPEIEEEEGNVEEIPDEPALDGDTEE